MPRPIDADALSKSLSDRHDRLGGTTNPVDHCIMDVLLSVIEDIEEAPTLDYAPVVHGEWLHGMKCSNCPQIDVTKPNYCPNCGALMDGGLKDENA